MLANCTGCSTDTPKPDHLHMVDLDVSVCTLADGVMLTSGLGVFA